MSLLRGASLCLLLWDTAKTFAHAVHLPRQVVTNSSSAAVSPTGSAPASTTETVTLAGSITGRLEDSSILVIGSSTILPSEAITIGSNTVSRDASSNVIVDGTTTLPIASLTDTSTGPTTANVPSQSTGPSQPSKTDTGSTQAGATAPSSGGISTSGSSSTGPITLPPATTTLPPAIFTSSASTASSEIVALLPVISSWIDNPGGDTGPVLSSIEGVKGELEGLLSSSGSSSAGCSSARKFKRSTSKRDLIGDAVNRIAGAITCAVQDLTKISGSIISGDITGVQGVLNGLTGVANTVGGNDGSENADNNGDNDDDNNNDDDDDDDTDDENDNEDEDDSDDDNDDNSTSKQQSSTYTSSSSSCSSATAMLVTSNCVVSTITSDSSSTTTTTCTSSTTVETSGCSVTDSTTSVLTTSSVGLPPQCASTNCGTACNLQPGPLTVSPTPGSTQKDCTFATTVTTDVLPTATNGLLEPGSVEDSVASAVLRAKRASPVTAEDQTDGTSSANISIRMIEPPNPRQYVSGLNPMWVSQFGDVSGVFYSYENRDEKLEIGVNGIYGCAAVVVMSDKGALLSHVWEIPVFSKGDWKVSDDDTFQKAITALLDGTDYSQGVRNLKGTDASPGPLHVTRAPKVVVVSPYTDLESRKNLGITTTLHYQARTEQIAATLAKELTGNANNGLVYGYTRTDDETSSQDGGYQGRTILEYDPHDQWVTAGKPDKDGKSTGLQFGRYRLWVEDRNVFEQGVWVPRTEERRRRLSKRDVGIPNPCAAGDDPPPTSLSRPTASSGLSTGSASASASASASMSGSSSGFTTTTSSATTSDPDNPLGLPTLSVTQCVTSSCVGGQWIYSYLPTESPCPTETITTGCLSTAAAPSETSAAPAPPPEPALVCGNLVSNNNMDPFTAGVGVPVCFADEMVSIFCSTYIAGDAPLIGGRIQPHTSIFQFKYQSKPPNAATDALYISLQDVEDPRCTPPVLDGKESNGIDDQCVSTLMGIINDCDTQTGSKKKGGTHNIDCQVWSIFPVGMNSVADDSPKIWSGDAEDVNDAWHYCNDPDHFLDVGEPDD